MDVTDINHTNNILSNAECDNITETVRQSNSDTCIADCGGSISKIEYDSIHVFDNAKNEDKYAECNVELNGTIGDDIKNIDMLAFDNSIDDVKCGKDDIETNRMTTDNDATINSIDDGICANGDSAINANTLHNIIDDGVHTTLKKYKNLVLCGGGIKGLVHIGVLHALYDIGILNGFDCFIGSSVGGLIIALHSIGYSSAELYDFIKSFDLKLLKNLSILNIDSFGLDAGHNFEYVTKRLIERKGFNENITLKEIHEKTKKKIVLVTVCVNDLNVCYLSYETFPDLPLYIAIRMTTSIPFIYCPVQYNGKMYIDGGGLDNYPMSYFENGLHDTIGILITESNTIIDKIDNLETYIFRVLQCMMICMTNNCKKGYENNTIEVQLDAVDFTNFGIEDELKDLFIINGYKSIINNINKFII